MWSALTGLVVSVALGLGSVVFRFESPAWSAVLDGFSINTQDKSVTVTLYTDQRVSYTTETQDRQFTIVLPNAQLSPSQVEDGLPVVIDNKNRFIGRAVPTDDGQIKIILPNLPADEYTVSIQQRAKTAEPERAAANPAQKPEWVPVSTAPAIQPRPAVKETDQQAFERVAARFQKRRATKSTPSPSTKLQLSPAKTASTGTIWNPYVVREEPKNTVAQTTPGKPESTTEPVGTLSVAEPPPSRPSTTDPLWYLHSLPPAPLSNGLTTDDLQGLAKASLPTLESQPSTEATSTAPQLAPERPIHELKMMVKKLPHWLWIALGVFLGGLGLFGLIGALVLLKMLFVQARPQTIQPALVMTEPLPVAAPQRTSTPASKAEATYASEPPKVFFADTTSVNALDYLGGQPVSAPKGDPHSVLLRFPRTRMNALTSKPKAKSGSGKRY